MGGLGSTRWAGHRAAETVEACAAFPISALSAAVRGAAAPQGSCRWTLTRSRCLLATWELAWTLAQTPEAGQTVRVSVQAQERGVMRQGSGRLSVQTTVPPYGGVRYWWTCPACTQRVAVLYLPPGATLPACRTCYRRTYRTCQAHDKRQDRYRRLPLWERWRLLQQMPPPDLPPPEAVTPQEHRAALSQALAQLEEQAAVVQSLGAPGHSAAYYARRRERASAPTAGVAGPICG